MIVLPILLLCCYRLEELKATLESILSQEHGDIYVSCDGPPAKFAEEGLEVQKYVKALKAQGKIHELNVSDFNQGILIGVTSGVSWFFENVDVGIIVEDDLVLQPDFLKSIELASTRLNQETVVAIGLHNSVPREFISNRHLVLRSSRFVISWGWVTTKINWENRIRTYGEVNYFKLFIKMFVAIGLSSSLYHLHYYRKRVKEERTNIYESAWADLWQINAFMKNLIVLTYNDNFVRYIGYSEMATHTKVMKIKYPLNNISQIELDDKKISFQVQSVDRTADRYFTKNRKVSTIIRGKLKLRTRLKCMLNVREAKHGS